MIVQITSNEQSQHLVAIVKGTVKFANLFVNTYVDALYSVPEAENQSDMSSPWFVFNDFMVNNVSEREALSFAGKWKVKSRLSPPFIIIFMHCVRFLPYFI